MKFDILTLFPEMFAPLKASIISRAEKNGIIEINLINIRDFSTDRHKKCDDTPFGGGAGMIMTAQPIADAIRSVITPESKLIYLSAKGETLSQKKVVELSKCNHIVLLCGHYEGIDQRIIDIFNPIEISIGNYVLTGGEIPAMVLVDSVSRYVDGVLSQDSLLEESYSNGMLEYPQFTKPQVFEGKEVPSVLISGNHAEIAKWRAQQSEQLTKKMRADLLEKKK